MSNMTIERALELYPYLSKLDKDDLMRFFMDLTKFLLVGKKDDGMEHVLDGIITFMKDAFENKK